jgi:decaprenylphospho-beta-D-ribofuranose 2-oxidase
MAETQALPAGKSLAGWGLNLRATCELAEPETPAEIIARLKERRAIARGLGRSYGDPALNSGGLVLGMRKLDRYLDFDEAAATLTCEAGVSLAQIIRDFAPRGFFPLIVPGTKFVTVGGAIANDIHGKAHHKDGSFLQSVESMRVLLASGDVVTASRTENSDLFWASFGGMGLLGIVLSAKLRLRRIETTYLKQQVRKVRDLEDMLTALGDFDKVLPYSVASCDLRVNAETVGRGVVNAFDHAKLSELPPDLARDPLRIGRPVRLGLPFEVPEFALNRLTVGIVNAYVMFTQGHGAPFAHYENTFFPLDIANDWNRAYGHRGFVQYQFVVPFDHGLENLRAILGAIFNAGELPFLNILKRFGNESGGMLSFPRAGYTFAIDFPVRARTAELAHELDAMVLDAGGRIYLGKDSYVTAETFRRMYPRIDEWLAVKAKYDPENVFVSDQARRVGLVPASAR